jgi:hypothetical protein
MRPRHALATGLAACHLTLAVCGAAHLPLLSVDSLAGKALALYGALSGSDNGYGFFAPSVSSQLRVTFSMTDSAGRRWTDVLARGHNREADLRIGGIVSMSSSEEWRRGLAASWAARMFGSHPEASQVVIRIEVYDVPSMAEYQEGKRPEWNTVYEATLFRDRASAPVLGK